MAKVTARRSRIPWLVVTLLAASVLLSSCNLGQQAPPEPLLTPPAEGDLFPQEVPGQAETQPPLIEVPATNTPPGLEAQADLQPAEQLGPITVQAAADQRVEQPVTVRVTVGTLVSNLSCNAVHQETNRSFPLGTPTQTAIDANTTSNVYTFTPMLAGTYSISCTGVTTTAEGQRAVSAVSSVFTAEAKG
ncbi:MAG TPA: hypothetical protein VKY39_01950 [Aggregatilineales bacterium]|nr:hypothetical protein [Aggregatilineales bacterium]